MFKARVTDSNDWFNLWFDDKNWILEIMVRNMQDDLNVGYNYFGKSIREQREQIDAYKAEIDAQMDKFHTMTEQEVNKWCFYDMKKRGVIE